MYFRQVGGYDAPETDAAAAAGSAGPSQADLQVAAGRRWIRSHTADGS
jgi:hypothetical protein